MDSDAAQLALLIGAVEPEREPTHTPLLVQRSWRIFDSRLSALKWSLRHAPLIPEGVRGVSAHPRARQATLGWVLVYDGNDTACRKFVLNKRDELERMR